MKFLRQVIILTFFVLFCASNTFAQTPLNIALVDLNRALNDSEKGIKSKNLLESRARQRQEELKLEQEELQKLADDLRNNLLLTPEAKKQKEQQLKQREQVLRQTTRSLERELRREERRLTEEIYNELKPVIRTVAMREKFDLVLEKNASEIILFMNQDMTDLTQKVIDYYNSLQHSDSAPPQQ